MSTNNIWEKLRKRYPPGEYALMEEVSDAAGLRRSNSADYIAVGLWPSRGLHVIGIELKSYRGDWLRELKNPAKAENIFKYCDFFWLLTADERVANLEEIPGTWGWMVVKDKRIMVKKDAPKLTPVEISRDFMAAMLKRAENKDNFIHRDSVRDEIEAARIRGEEKSSKIIEHLQKELGDLQKDVRDFEKAIGVQLNFRWGNSAEEISRAILFLRSGGADGVVKRLESLQTEADGICHSIKAGVRSLKLFVGTESGDGILNESPGGTNLVPGS